MIVTIRRIALSWALLAALALPSLAQTLGNYTYDASGNIQSIGPDANGVTSFYDYDSAGRLIRFVRRNASGAALLTETYEYDAYGNQTSQTVNNVATTTPADPATNRLTAASYDAAGSMQAYGAESYVYDPVGTMTKKSGSWGSAFYVYTADDERIGVEGPDGTWRYMARDFDGKVLREWSAASGTAANWAWVEDYVYRDGQLAAAVRPATQGGVRHFHLDHLGTPRLITSADSAVYAAHDYAPFGRELTSPTQELAIGHDTPEPMKFTGHERDFAGSYTGPVLDYMHARYYNPQAARFVSVDPALDVDKAIRDPQRWNHYAYVRNRPMTSTDPTGAIIYDQLTDENGKEELRKQLEKKTGIGLKYDQGQLQATGEIITDANGNQAGSPAARADLQKALAPGVTYIMTPTTNPAHGMAAQQGPKTFINFGAMRQVIGGKADGGTFDFAMIVMHEMLGHGVNKLKDNYSNTNPTGDTVDYENRIRRELGIKNERLEYVTHKDGPRYYIKFTDGRVWVPQP